MPAVDIRSIFLAYDGPLLGFRLIGHEVRSEHPSQFSAWCRQTRELIIFYSADLAVHLVWDGAWKRFSCTKREVAKCKQLNHC